MLEVSLLMADVDRHWTGFSISSPSPVRTLVSFSISSTSPLSTQGERVAVSSWPARRRCTTAVWRTYSYRHTGVRRRPSGC